MRSGFAKTARDSDDGSAREKGVAIMKWIKGFVLMMLALALAVPAAAEANMTPAPPTK